MLKKQSDLLSSMEGRTARPQVHETKFPSKHVRLLQALAANFGSIRYLMQQLTRQSLPAFGLDGSGLDAFSKPLLKAAESEGVSTEDEEEVQRGYAVLWTLQAVAVQLVDNGLQAAHAFLEESVKKLRFIASDVRESVQASRHAVVTESVDRPKLASFLSIMARVAATWTYPGAPEPRILVVTNRWTLSTISRLLASLGLLPYCLADDDIVDDIQAGVAGVADVLKRVLEDALSEHNCIVARAEVVTEDFPTDRFTAVIVYSSGDSAVEMAGSIARRAACPVHAISQAAIDAVVCETRSRWAEKSGTKGAKKTSTRSPSAGQASAGRPGTKSGHVQHNQAPEKEKPGKPDPNGPRARRASELNTSNDSPVRERRPDATEVNPEQAPSPCGHVTEQDAAAAGATPAEVGLKPSPAADGVPLEAVDARVDSWRSARDPLETGSGRVCESGLKKGFVTGPEKGFETGLERGWEEGLAGGSETGLAGGLETGVNRSSAGGSDTGLAGVLKTSAETGLDAGLETGLAEGLGTGLAENSKTGVKTQLVGGSETGLAGSLKTGAGTGLAGGSETGLAGGLKTGVEGGLKTGLETGSAEDVKRGVETNPETGSRAAEGRPVFVVVNSNSSEIQERGPLREAIAGLQREGVAQVVERAMTLPVDLVIHGGTCVRLLTPERLGLRNPFQAGDPSTVSTKHVVDWLRRVFEGSRRFLAMIKATLTPILNAADDCQTLLLPYLSNHPGSTLEFFVGAVISIQSRPAQNPNALPSLPPLNETPTTIEKFLTSFPSVHPVAAHAIMCSGLYVHDFAELPEEAQRARTQGFSVPVRSLRLFSKHIAGLTDRIRAQSGVSPEVHEGKEGALTCAASVDNGAGQGLGCAHLLRPEIGCACGGGRRERLDDGVALEGSCLNGERESVTRGDGPAGSRSQGRKVGSDPFSADRSAGNQAQRPCEGELSSEGKEVGHAAGSAAPPRFALGEGRLLTTAALEKSVAAAEEAATTQLSRGQEEAGGRALSTEAAPPNALQKDERCKSGKSRAAERGQISGTSTNSRMDGKPSPDTGPDASTRSASAKARGEKGGRAADDSAAARDDRSRRHSAKRLTSKNPAVAFPNILQKIDKTWQQAGGGDPEVASSSRGPVQNGGNAPCDPVHSAAAAAGAPHEWEGGVISNAEENGQRAGVGHTECRSGGKRKAACVASPARKRVRGPDLAMQRAIRTLTRPDGVDDGAEKKEPVKEGLRSGLIRIPLPELQTSGNGEKRIQEKTKRATQEAGRAQRSPQSDPCTARHEEGRGGRGGPGVGNCKDSKGTPQAQGKRKGRAESLRASKRNRNVGTQAEPGSRIVLQASKTIMVSNQSTAGLERNERSEVNDERIPRSGEGGTQGRAETAGRWVGQRRAICCGTAMAGQPVRTVQGAEAGAARRHTLRARPWPQQKQNESVSNAPFDEDSEAPAQWSADADYEPLPRGRRNLRTITARATSTDALALEGAANAANAAEGAARPLQVGAQTTQREGPLALVEYKKKKPPNPRKGGLQGQDKALADLERLNLPPEEAEAVRMGESGREAADTKLYAELFNSPAKEGLWIKLAVIPTTGGAWSDWFATDVDDLDDVLAGRNYDKILVYPIEGKLIRIVKGAFGVREQWTSGSDIPGKLEFIEEDFLLLGLLHKEIVEKHGASYARLWLASTFTRSAEVVGQVRVPAAEHTVVPLDDPPVTYLLSELIESGALRGLVKPMTLARALLVRSPTTQVESAYMGELALKIKHEVISEVGCNSKKDGFLGKGYAFQAKHATPAIALSASMNVPVIELAFWGSKHYYLGAENSFTSGNGDFDAALGFGLEVDKLACALVGLPVELRKRFTEAFGEKVVMISKHQLIKAGAVSWHEGDGGKGSVLHVAAMKPLFVRVAQNGGLEVFQGSEGPFVPGPAAVPFDEDVENAFDRFLDDYIPRNLDEVCTQQKIVSELIQQRNRNRAAGVPEEIPDKFRQRAKAVIQRLKLRKTLPPLQLGENTFDKRYYEGRPKIERKFFCVYDTSSLPPRIVFKYSDPSREKTWARAEEAIVKSRFIGVSFDDGTGRYNWCNGLWPNKKQCKQNMEGEKQDKPGGKRELFAAIRRETAGLLRHVASGRSAGKFKGNFGGGLPGEELMDEFKVTAEEVNKQVQIAREWYAENSVMNR